MARTPKKTEVIDLEDTTIDTGKVGSAMVAMRDQAQQEQAELAALAEQIGYDGTLTVGALEDEIRFYQRRTVEAIIEVGRRLVMLKKMTPHGEFERRVELLGFAERTARRFMQAAQKIRKSANLAVLSTQVKNASVFLELVTHDDDADLDRLAEMDDIDRMSASQVREALRKEKRESERQKAVNEELNAEAIQLKLKGKVVAHTSWPEALVPVADQVAAAGRKLATALSELETCRIAIFTAGEPLGDADRTSFEAALGHVADVYQEALARAERAIERERLTFDQTLGAFAEGGAQ